MRSHKSVLCWTGTLVLLTLATGCSRSARTTTAPAQALDLTRDGQYTADAWTYSYAIGAPGTRSEGYFGKLDYKETELPAPLHVNDFYKTPWGPLYWVGKPLVPWGVHGWMPKPLTREPAGRALIDPGIVHTGRFLVELMVLTPEELATPDRLERDSALLESLKPFGVTEAHVQSKWLPVGSDPITLHDTKRWGTLKVCRSDLQERPAPTLEFTCATDLSLDTSPKPTTLAELMPAPELLDKPNRISLCPQVDTLQPIQCTLSPVIGDPLVLYVVCRIEDQGPTPPWTSPNIRVLESEPSGPADSSHP